MTEGPFERDRWGRPVVPDPDTGEPVAYQRVSTFASMLSDKTGLMDWQSFMAVKGAAVLPDVAERVAASTRTPNALIGQLIEAAGGRDAANRGVARHEIIAAALTGGRLPALTDEQAAELSAVVGIVRGLGEVVAVEAPVVCDRWRVAGSADLILRCDDGRTAVLDVKTGGYLDDLACMVQLAGYASGRAWTAQGRGGWVAASKPLLGVVWAPQNGAPACLVEYDAAEARALGDLARWVRDARNGRALRRAKI